MILKEINYKNYNFKIKASDEIYSYNYLDSVLEINKNNQTIKSYKLKHDFTFYYKIQKTQIKSSNIYQIFDNINKYDSISYVFFDKLIELNK